MIGLIGQPEFPAGTALILPGTPWIHTWCMTFPIDVVFCDGSGHVLMVIETLRPWRISPFCWRARDAIELPAGTIRLSGTRPGDLLRIQTQASAVLKNDALR